MDRTSTQLARPRRDRPRRPQPRVPHDVALDGRCDRGQRPDHPPDRGRRDGCRVRDFGFLDHGSADIAMEFLERETLAGAVRMGRF